MVTFANRAKMTVTSTGTGTITLGVASDGYQTFAAAGVVNADVVRYTIEDGASWEIGSGTYSSGTLTRVLDESSTGSLLNLTTAAEVYVTAAAEDILQPAGGTMTGDLSFPDNSKAIFGAGSDLQIYSDGNSVFFKELSGTGSLFIDGNFVTIRNTSGTETKARFVDNGAVELYYDNAIKLATTATGIDVTGTVTATSFVTTGDMTFGDNDKAIFGAGSDLQIYHDAGTGNSFIDEQGPGNLIVRGTQLQLKGSNGSDMADFTTAGAARLFYSNAAKLATTATGIDVTGTVTADGLAVAAASAGRATLGTFTNTTNAGGTEAAINLVNLNANCDVSLVAARTGANFGSDFYIETSDGVDGTNRKRLNIAEDGDISFYEDTGTTPKFFWDASTERLGIGNATPTTSLDVTGTVTATAFAGPLTGAVTGNATTATNITGYSGTYWTSNNDGAGSGLDADLLDGLPSTDYSRKVMETASGGASDGNYWAKIATYTITGNFNDGTFLYFFMNEESSAFSSAAIVAVSVRTNNVSLAQVNSVSVSILGMHGTDPFNDDAFKLLDNGSGTAIELWVQKNSNYDHISVYEHSAHMEGTVVTYNNNAAWQVSEPVGTGNNVRSAGLVYRNNKVWNAGNDGSGSGLDADLLDGVQGSSFLRSDAADTASGVITFTDRIELHEIRTNTNQELILNAGESAGFAASQTGELVYINAEDGLQINSSPDNWASGWAGRRTASINNTSGQSSFPSSVGIGTTSPAAQLHVAGSTNNTATFTASITGTTLDVTAVSSGTLSVGDIVYGAGVSPITKITALGTGSGGTGTYTVSVSQTRTSTTLYSGSGPASTIRISDTDFSAQAGQPQGTIEFFGSDTSSPGAGVGAYISAINESITPDSALTFGTRDNAGGGVDANERMRIDSSGDLLVGKTAQSVDTVGGEILSTGIGQFTVYGNFAGRFTRQNSDGDIVVFRKDTGTVGSIGAASGGIYFGSGSSGTERMRIDSTGNVGIGTASPTSKLDVAGTVTGTALYSTSGFVENSQTVSADYTLVATRNAMSAGPIEVASGVTVTIETGARWVVI